VPSGELSYTDTGFAERVEAQVESLQAVVTSVARSLAEPLRAVRPDEVSVEFGIELTAKAGKVVGLLADGEAKAGIKVTLTWNGGPPVPDSPASGSSGTGSSGTGSSDDNASVPEGAGTEGAGSAPGSAAPRSADGERLRDGRAGASSGASVQGGAGAPSTGGGA
jgi:hypothetical protein